MDCVEWHFELDIRRTWILEDAYLSGEITFDEMIKLEAEEVEEVA